MPSTVTINPALSSVAANTFGVQWDGLIQGMAWPDPAIRYTLNSGWLSEDEDLPMWGGVGISEDVPASAVDAPDPAQGGEIIRALNVLGGNNAGNLTGFSVFDQGYSAINSPQSPVPLVGSFGQVMLYRLGSGARIAVKADATLALQGELITKPVSWDYINQQLVAFQAAWAANTITAGSWAAGIATLTTNTAHGVSPGGVVTISGIDPDGYNGTFVATAGTTASTLKYAVAANPGAYSSGGDLAAGGGALPCRVLKFATTNCMTVSFDSATGFATWNRNGSAAVILI